MRQCSWYIELSVCYRNSDEGEQNPTGLQVPPRHNSANPTAASNDIASMEEHVTPPVHEVPSTRTKKQEISTPTPHWCATAHLHVTHTQLTFSASPPCLGSHCAGDELLIQPGDGLCASCRNLIKSDSCSNRSGHDHSCIARGKTPHWLKQYTQCDQMALAVGGRGQLCASHAAFVKPDMLG